MCVCVMERERKERKRQKESRKRVMPLETHSETWHSVASATFYWPESSHKANLDSEIHSAK